MNLNLWKQHNPTFTPAQIKTIRARTSRLATHTAIDAIKRNKHIVPIASVLGVKKWF